MCVCRMRSRIRRNRDHRYHVLAPLRRETLGNMGKLYRPVTLAERISAREGPRYMLERTKQLEPTWPGSVFIDGRSEMLLLLLARPVQWFPRPAPPDSGGELKMAEQESNLLRLPRELLEMVLGYTSHRDTFAVALTCMTAWHLVKHHLHRHLMQILGRWAGTPLIAAGERLGYGIPPALKGLSHDMPGFGPTGWQAQVLGKRYDQSRRLSYLLLRNAVDEVELLEDEKFVGLKERIEEVIALGTQGKSTNGSLTNTTTTTLAEESVSASASTSTATAPSHNNWSPRTYLHLSNPLTPEIEGLLYPFTTSFYPSDREWVLRNHFHKVYVRGKSLHYRRKFGLYKTKGRLGKFDPVGFEEVLVWAGLVWGDRMTGSWAGCGFDLVPWEEFERELADEEKRRAKEGEAEEGRNRNESKGESESRANEKGKGKGKEVEVKEGDDGKGEEESEPEVKQWEDVSAAILKIVKKRMKAPLEGNKACPFTVTE